MALPLAQSEVKRVLSFDTFRESQDTVVQRDGHHRPVFAILRRIRSTKSMGSGTYRHIHFNSVAQVPNTKTHTLFPHI